MTSALPVPAGLPPRRAFRTWPAVTLRWVVLAIILALVARSRPALATTALIAVASAAWLYWSWFDPRTRPWTTMGSAFTFGFIGAVLAGGHGSAQNGGIAFATSAAVFLASNLGFALSAALDAVLMATLVAAGLATGNSGDLLGNCGVLAVAWAVGNGRRSRTQRAEAAEALLAETIRANEGRAEAGALAERARIAREIHDVLAHSLSALTLQLEAVDALLIDGRDPGRAHAMVLRARRTARDGLDESRRAVSALRDDVKPLRELLTTLVDGYRADTGADALLAIDGDPAAVPVEVAQGIQRVVREALTNVRKHAPGAAVTVRLACDVDGAVRVAIENAGVTQGAGGGSDGSGGGSGGGYGLVGVRERVGLLGGTVSAGPGEDGTGWIVSACVPSMTG